VFLLFPNTTEILEFKQSLVQSLEYQHYKEIGEIKISSFKGKDPFEILQTTYPDLSKYQYLEQMVEDDKLPDVILVSDFQKCLKEKQVEWVSAIKRWSEACRSTGSKRSFAILSPAQIFCEINAPAPDIRLVYRNLIGFPSALETRMLCRLNSNELNHETLWREYMISSLIGNDLLLGERLWDKIFLCTDEIINELCQYGMEKKWTKEVISSVLINNRPNPLENPISISPQHSKFKYISLGISQYTPEYGEETHSAVLALLGQHREIIHRIWRAQAALMLPMIDDVRLRVCDFLIDNYGRDWARKEEEEDNGSGGYVELGKLQHYFSGLPQFKPEKKRWSNAVFNTWRIRNELAHYKTITFQDFQSLWYIFSSNSKS